MVYRIAALLTVALALCAAADTARGSQPQKEIGAHAAAAPAKVINWRDSLKQPAEWYSTDEAVRVADNVLLYQHDEGGWSKNIDMARVLSDAERAGLLKLKSESGSNIDNGATHTQLAYLARVYTARKLARHREADRKST